MADLSAVLPVLLHTALPCQESVAVPGCHWPGCRVVTSSLLSCLPIQGLVHLHSGWNVLRNVFGNVRFGVVTAFHLRFIFWDVSPLWLKMQWQLWGWSRAALNWGWWQGCIPGHTGILLTWDFVRPSARALALCHLLYCHSYSVICACVGWMCSCSWENYSTSGHPNSHLEMQALRPARWLLMWTGQYPVPLGRLLVTKILLSRRLNKILKQVRSNSFYLGVMQCCLLVAIVNFM